MGVEISKLPSGLTVGIATFISYLIAYPWHGVTPERQTQASTAALITLLISALWVLATVARPYQWWRIALVVTSGLAYVVIFSIPWARTKFMLDPSNVALTVTAIAIGFAGAVVIEILWWMQGRWLGESRKLFR